MLRGVRRPARRLGILDFLERNRSNRWSLWIRSLFSIYDIDDLVRIDLPWWCLEATAAVNVFLGRRSLARVFEYGSGASTVWLARRVARIVSVEHDGPWRDLVAARLGAHPNATLMFVPVDGKPHANAKRYGSEKTGWKGCTFFEYVHAIERTAGPYDLIVVDGRARGTCLQVAIEQSGLAYRDCRGLTACLPYPDSTTLLAHNPAILNELLPFRGAD
jgi:hypothetical protein